MVIPPMRLPVSLPPASELATAGSPALQVDRLSAAYASEPILSEISFSVEPGQVLALIGPNGAGKSSLIRCLSGVLPLQGGRVRVSGQDITSLSPAARARMLAVVPQARNMPPAFTARETVVLGRTPHLNWLGQLSRQDEAIVRQAMLRTHTLHLADRRVGQLSGGEQQRLLLARALAQAAPVMLLDEPTTHLDLKYQIALLDQVRGLAQQEQLTVVLALHDLNLVLRYADLAALLVAGRLVAFGRPNQVLTAPLLSEAFGVPLKLVYPRDEIHPLVLPIDRSGVK